MGTVDVVISVPRKTADNCITAYMSDVVQYVFTGRFVIVFIDAFVLVLAVVELLRQGSHCRLLLIQNVPKG